MTVPDHELDPVDPPARYTEAQIIEYLVSLLLSKDLSIPAQNCAIHTSAVDWLGDKAGGVVGS